MATSNRDRVEHGLALLSEGLEPFIRNVLADRTPAEADWTALLAAKDTGRGGKRDYEPKDAQNQLRVITESLGPGWFPFSDHLSPAENRWRVNCATSATGGHTRRRSPPTTPTGHSTRPNGCCGPRMPSDRQTRSAKSASTSSGRSSIPRARGSSARGRRCRAWNRTDCPRGPMS